MQSKIIEQPAFKKIINSIDYDALIFFKNENGTFQAAHHDTSYQFTRKQLTETSALYVTLETKVPFISNNLSHTFLYDETFDNPFNFDIRHIAVIPCLLEKDKTCVWGILVFYQFKKNKQTFDFETIQKTFLKLKKLSVSHDIHPCAAVDNVHILEEKIEHSYQFFSSIVHDIRTPINAVMGFLDLLIDRYKEDSEGKEYIHSAHRSAEMVAALVNDVLDFAKVDLGKLELNMHYFSIMEEFENIVKSFYYGAHRKEINFTVYFDPLTPFLIYSDSHRIKQIINNLMSNAIKFTPKNGQILLNFNYDTKTDNLSIEVSDTGIGMSKEELKYVFQPFKQASSKTSGTYGGTGLGLTISKQIASMLGAELSVESQKGKGSTFLLKLPCSSVPGTPSVIQLPSKLPTIYLLEGTKSDTLYHAHIKRYLNTLNLSYNMLKTSALKEENMDTNHIYICVQREHDLSFMDTLAKKTQARMIVIEREIISDSYPKLEDVTILYRPLLPSQFFQALTGKNHSKKSKISKSPQQSSKKLNILVADDNIINLKLMKEVLKRYSSQIFTAANGKEAYDIFQKNPIDIVIIDEKMPEMNGSEAIQKIRMLKKGKETLIYSLTGDKDEETVMKIQKSGADRVLSKPIKNSMLEEIIEAHGK